ncbi:MAG: peptidoglycan editing factor PgeF [Thermodesulfovibrionales bacterium]
MEEVIITPELFEKEPVRAFFTGKKPGVDPDKIAKIGGIKKESLYTPIQKHTSEVIIVDPATNPAVADAVLTEKEGLMLGIHIADCVPILLYDKKKGVIGAVHAGWRGTASRILMKTIETMEERFSSDPSDILIAMGPSIRWCCYGVGYEVIEAVEKVTGEGEYMLQRDGKYCLDLPSANKYQALKAGIVPDHVWISNLCTYCEHERFYSFRFSKDGGRQGGFIVKG